MSHTYYHPYREQTFANALQQYIVVAIVDVTIVTVIYWLPQQLSSGKLKVIIKDSSPCYH